MAERARRRTLILGAAGRDFHDFNVVCRGDPEIEVVSFTAAQIPGISGRRYPPELAGPLYPDGIPIVDENELDAICRSERVDQVLFAYSDVPHDRVMHLASRALAAGADFLLLGPERTMLRAEVPAIAVSAVRTGCGKSQTTRWIARRLQQLGLRPGVIRHPMPYGDLAAQAVQRFARPSDLAAARCTLEEREEYEPHIAAGTVVYAGVDYARILALASAESDLILWDGGNNDFPFVRPDLHVVMVDPLRAGHETSHHPGEAVLRMADVVLLAKCDCAAESQIRRVLDNVRRIRPDVPTFRVGSPVHLDDPEAVRGRRAIVVEDGPTLTHGGMAHGAGFVAASRAGVAEIVDPRGSAAPEIARVYEQHPHIGPVLPALGYGPDQLEALRRTIEDSDADVVVVGTPSDLAAIARLTKPSVRAHYELSDLEGGLAATLDAFLARVAPGRGRASEGS